MGPPYTELFVPANHVYFDSRDLLRHIRIWTSWGDVRFQHVDRQPINEELERLIEEVESEVGITNQHIILLEEERFRYHNHESFVYDAHNPVASFRYRHAERSRKSGLVGRNIIPGGYVILELNAREERIRRFVDGTVPVEIEIEDRTETLYFSGNGKRPSTQEALDDQTMSNQFWHIIERLFEERPIDYVFFDPSFFDTAVDAERYFGSTKVDYDHFSERADERIRVEHTTKNGICVEDHYFHRESEEGTEQAKLRAMRFDNPTAMERYTDQDLSGISFPKLWKEYPSGFQVIWDFKKPKDIGEVRELVTGYKIPVHF